MAHSGHTVTLYTAQSQAVLDAMERDGTCFSRVDYVRRKYAESARVFLTAYIWLAAEMEKLVPLPAGAELPYWAFRDLYSLEQPVGGKILKLQVPVDQVVLFDLYDWNKVLQMKYLGQTEAEERAFQKELAQRGLRESDIMLTNFYPDLKQTVLDSWPRLLRHHRALAAGDLSGVGGVQAALWELRREWITE